MPSTSKDTANLITLRFQRNNRADLQRLRAQIDNYMADKDVEMGKRIAALRRASSYPTQDALFSRLYPHIKTKRSLQAWEAGTRPEWPNLVQLAKVLGTTTDYILHGDVPPPLTEQSQMDRLETKMNAVLRALAHLSPEQKEFLDPFLDAMGEEVLDGRDGTSHAKKNQQAGG